MIAIAASGAIWGVFWIPLRATHDAGISAAWSIVLFYLLPIIALLPGYLWRWRALIAGGWRLHIACICAGVSLSLYAGAFLFTTVVNAMLLYYLTPIWATLLARVALDEAITRDRWTTIALSFLGMQIILSDGFALPWPRNIGDWMGLTSGVMWAVASVLIRRDEKNKITEYTLGYFVWGAVAALALTALPLGEEQTPPTWEVLADAMPILGPIIILLVIPPTVGVLWGAQIVSPGLLGVIFMTEISVGAVTAAIWADEPFGAREALGVLLITAAGLWEPVRNALRTAPTDRETVADR